MTRGLFAGFVLAGLLLGVAPQSAWAQGKKPRKPNIILLVADDLGYADVGFHGGKDVKTPHIDSLAKHGIRFSSGYVSGPYCSPTRSGIMTGKYQNRYGHEFNPLGPKNGMPTTE